MTKPRQIGVAVIGAGRIGTLRARMASRHPSVHFLAVSDKDPERASTLANAVGAQLSSGTNLDAIAHPEVDAVIVSTSEHEHTEPLLQALFMQSNSSGDWAMGDYWGPIANETRSWLDHLVTGRPCPHTTVREGRLTRLGRAKP